MRHHYYFTVAVILFLIPGYMVQGQQPTDLEAQTIEAVDTWQNLLDQPAIKLETGTARIGLEAKTGPCGSGVLLYCLTEGYESPGQREGSSFLGPFEVEIVRENDMREQVHIMFSRLPNEQRKKNWNLYRKSISLAHSGSLHVRVKSKTGDIVGEAHIKTNQDDYHYWLTLSSDVTEQQELEEATGEHDAVGYVKSKSRGIAIPKFGGLTVLGFDLPTESRARQQFLQNPLPKLFHCRTGEGLKIKKSDTDIIVESKTNIVLRRPDQHFLVRWWVNGEPYVPQQQELSNESENGGGLVSMGKKLLLRLDFNEAHIGAKPGDKIELQLLYCKNGWELVSPNIEMLSAAHHDPIIPDLLLSNRIQIQTE